MIESSRTLTEEEVLMWPVGSYKVAELHDGARLAEARAFCNLQYGRHGYITRDSDSFPQTFLGVYRGDELHGTIGTYLKRDLGEGNFPTEAVFGFSLAEAGIDPAKVGEVSRFSGDGTMFVPVLSFMARHMFREMGLTHALFGVKPYINEGLGRMGIPTHVHTEFREPILTKVPEEFLPYFEKPPTPIVVTVDLAAAQAAVNAHLRRLAA